MIDCSKEISMYHSEKVRLSAIQRQEMRDRRQANQNRTKRGLEKNDDPAPKRNVKQGSYAMHTMVQSKTNDYDIDDGVIFDRDSLKGPQGGDKTPKAARDMVRNAVDDGSFTEAPKTLKNCVRVYYQTGYHVDIPVYREYEEDGKTILEIASASEWRESDPEKIAKWFKEAVTGKSPDSNNGQQMRRIVVLLKRFARSRNHWNMPSGLILSVLADAKYVANDGRDDESLYDTMKSIYDRLVYNGFQVFNPVDADEELTKGPEDAKMSELRDRLKWATDKLLPVKNATCSKKSALKRWKEIFNDTTGFFDDLIDKEDDDSAGKLDTIIKTTAASSPRQWSC